MFRRGLLTTKHGPNFKNSGIQVSLMQCTDVVEQVDEVLELDVVASPDHEDD